jgi:CBS domain-containing protein
MIVDPTEVERTAPERAASAAEVCRISVPGQQAEGAMRVGDVMTRAVETTTPWTTLQAAALKMREAGVGVLPVIEEGSPSGIITDRDITIRATANGMDPRTSRVAEAMTRTVHSCHDDDTLEEAVRRMREGTVRRLVVLDRYEKMVGLITLDDLSALPTEALVVSTADDVLSMRGDAPERPAPSARGPS